MRTINVLFFILISCDLFSQSGEWVWVHGTSNASGTANYGTMGIPDPLNRPSRIYEGKEWTDLNGKFWLLENSDLLRYDPLTNEWTWIKGPNLTSYGGNYGVQGVPSITNIPASRGEGAATWVDNQGNFWLFGGKGSGGTRNDLWKYEIASNMWTWIKGSNLGNQVGVYGTQGVPGIANTPGSRYECSSAWTDNSGDLWLFGGILNAGTNYNDLWRYQIATNMWTWMKGSNIPNQAGVYGIKGVEAPANTPGARASYTHWKDAVGYLYLFGGEDIIAIVSHNDLWRYNPFTNNWAWINGSNLPDAPSVYNVKCDTASVNTPGARFETRVVWTDQFDNFWLFGGGKGGGANKIYNDLWKYCPSINQWILISGDTIANPAGNWGIKGVSSPTNMPNGRVGGLGWTDKNYHLYFYGGSYLGFSNPRNDLWKYTIDSTCGSCFQIVAPPVVNFNSSDTILCEKDCINFFDFSINNPTSWQWYLPGGTPNSSTLKNPANICYNSPGVYPVTLVAYNSIGNDSMTVNNLITVYSNPQISLGNDTALCLGDTLRLTTNQSFPYYLWQNGLQDSVLQVVSAGTYWLQVFDGNCYAYDTISINFSPCNMPMVSLASSDTLFCGKHCIDFYDLSTNNPTAWQWYFPGADSTSSNMQNPVGICYNSYGSFDVTLIACNAVGCDTLFLPDFIREFPNPPVPLVTVNFDTLFSTPAFSYQWYFNSLSIPGATDSFYVFQQQGTYFVIIADSNGCASASNALYSAIDEFAGNDGIYFIPNPNDGNFILNGAPLHSTIKIFDVAGRLLYSRKVKTSSDKIHFKAADGIYFVEIDRGDRLIRKKILLRN